MITYQLRRIGPGGFNAPLGAEVSHYSDAEHLFEEHCQNGLKDQEIVIEEIYRETTIVNRFKFHQNTLSGKPAGG